MKTAKKKTWLRSWGTLILSVSMIALFALVAGPWLEQRIPIFNQIVNIIEEQDIESSAYFYSEVEASYTSEKELAGSILLKSPDQSGVTLPFVSGIIISLMILIIGFRHLPE
ncbi:MAG: hypothetical protein GY729_18090 [Desulfobacteraceae bacterium]|nr:hypothetical protein [Desulfobacteraceae bacterium]